MDNIDALKARIAIDDAAAHALMACADIPALISAANGFMQRSEEAIALLLASTHGDAAALMAQERKEHWAREFAKAVAARAGS